MRRARQASRPPLPNAPIRRPHRRHHPIPLRAARPPHRRRRGQEPRPRPNPSPQVQAQRRPPPGLLHNHRRRLPKGLQPSRELNWGHEVAPLRFRVRRSQPLAASDRQQRPDSELGLVLHSHHSNGSAQGPGRGGELTRFTG